MGLRVWSLANSETSGLPTGYGFNRDTGDIAPVMEYSAAAPADRLRGWIYSVHTGGFGGVPARILWLLIALFGASLPLTGYYIWIKHLIKVRR